MTQYHIKKTSQEPKQALLPIQAQCTCIYRLLWFSKIPMWGLYALLTLASSTEPWGHSKNSLRMTRCFIYIHSGCHSLFLVCVCVYECESMCQWQPSSPVQTERRRREKQTNQWTDKAFIGGQVDYCGSDQLRITQWWDSSVTHRQSTMHQTSATSIWVTIILKE